MIVCARCGAANEPSSKFCPSCGASLAGAGAAKAGDLAAAPPLPPLPAPGAPPPAFGPPDGAGGGFAPPPLWQPESPNASPSPVSPDARTGLAQAFVPPVDEAGARLRIGAPEGLNPFSATVSPHALGGEGPSPFAPFAAPPPAAGAPPPNVSPLPPLPQPLAPAAGLGLPPLDAPPAGLGLPPLAPAAPTFGEPPPMAPPFGEPPRAVPAFHPHAPAPPAFNPPRAPEPAFNPPPPQPAFNPPPPQPAFGEPPRAAPAFGQPAPAFAPNAPLAPLPGPLPARDPATASAPPIGRDPESIEQGAPRVLAGFLVSFEHELGVFWPLYQGINVVGRRDAAPGLDVQIDHPTTSSRHAIVYAAARPGRLKVEDTGSTNGTVLGDMPLERGRKYELRDGDTIRFGGYGLIVKLV